MTETEPALKDASPPRSLPRPRFDYSYHHRLFQAPTSTKTHPVGIRSGPDSSIVVSEEEKYLVDDPIKQRILLECTELLQGIQLEQVIPQNSNPVIVLKNLMSQYKRAKSVIVRNRAQALEYWRHLAVKKANRGFGSRSPITSNATATILPTTISFPGVSH